MSSLSRQQIYSIIEDFFKNIKEDFTPISSLEKLLRRVFKNPENENFRKIKSKSKKLNSVLEIKGGNEVLEAIGFTKLDDIYYLPIKVPIEKIENFLDAVYKYGYKKPELYKVKLDDHIFEISTRYELKKVVGSGAYGVVASGYDKYLERPVAIKKVLHTFEHGKDYQKRILREIKIMKHFKDQDGIISLIDLISPEDFENFKDIYIVMHLMDGDLKKIRDSTQELNEDSVKYFIYHILLGVYKIHSANVLHRDLKPSNILIDKEMEVRICDFGLSRGIDVEDPSQSTLYVATRWYRSPELLLQYPKSSKSIDLWSVGCIFGELLQKEKRRPLFQGKNYLNQIDLILDQLGTPKEEELKGSQKALNYLKTLPLKLKKDWKKKVPDASELAIDLLDKLLSFDPDKRISAEDALKHPFLEDHFSKEDLEQIPEFTYSFDESIDLTKDKDAIKKIIYDEIVEFNIINNHLYGDAIIKEE